MNKIPFVFKNKGDKLFNTGSKDISFIHVYTRLLNKYGISQKRIVELSLELTADEQLSAEIKPIKHTPEISAAKKSGVLNPERITEIRACMAAIAKFKGIENVVIEQATTQKITGSYIKASSTNIKLEDVIKFNEKNIRKQGLYNILDGNLSDLQVLHNAINEAYELRILQSILYNWRFWEELFRKAIINGKLRVIKILLAQPYSDMAKERTHTFGTENITRFENFNNHLKTLIGGIHTLMEDFNKKDREDKISIELRLFYRPASIPVYQCLDKEEKNKVTFWGIFWQNNTAFKGPHLQLIGNKNKANLVQKVTDYFKEIWEDISVPTDSFNWYKHLKEKKTIPINLEEDYQLTLNNFEKAYRLKTFTNFHKSKPKWIIFNCFYYGSEDKQSNLILKLDLQKRIAKVEVKRSKNIYYGTITKLRHSFAIYLHSVDPHKSDKVIFIHIHIQGDDLSSGKNFYAIYNNLDNTTGVPYAQLMRLVQKGNLEEKDKAEKTMFKLKDKKIKIANSLSANYTYHFKREERGLFYKMLQEEIINAKDEIYFLGHGPVHFKSSMQDYFNKHKEIIINHEIRINRIILNDKVHPEFITYLVDLKEQETTANYFRLFVSKFKIPILSDLILIDPQTSNSIAIHNYFKNEWDNSDSYPIKMEVIKSDRRMIKNAHDTCLDYLKQAEPMIKELTSVKAITRWGQSME